MEKKRRAGLDARVFNSRSSEGSRLSRWAHCCAGRVGRRQTREAAGAVGRRQAATRTGGEVKRIKHNDLLPYFIMDERSLAKRKAYVRSCEKFFNGLGRASKKKVDKQSASAYIGNYKKG